MKKIMLVLIMAMVVLGSAIAEPSVSSFKYTTGESGAETRTIDLDSKTFTIFGRQVDNPFAGAFSFFLKIIIGAVGGALMALRFTVELAHALIMNGNESMPGELQKVVIRFIIHFSVALLGTAVILNVMGIFG